MPANLSQGLQSGEKHPQTEVDATTQDYCGSPSIHYQPLTRDQHTGRNTPMIQLNVQTDLQYSQNQTQSPRVPYEKESPRLQTFEPLTTPPASPVRHSHPYSDLKSHPTSSQPNTTTPPRTPTGPMRPKRDSGFATLPDKLSGVHIEESPTSNNASLHALPDHSSKDLVTFPYQRTDYSFFKDDKNKKVLLGSGAFSDVFSAISTLGTAGAFTPPITPVHSRNVSSANNDTTDTIPPTATLYAIKIPASTSSRKILAAEARVLSYLTRQPGSANHIVPFYGQDPRNFGLVLKCMPQTFESWINSSLSCDSEALRAERLAQTFPHIATSLLNSLAWLHDQGCIHGDIKPSNILVSEIHPSGIPSLVFSDFSSALVNHPSFSIHPEGSPIGAGTWTYLDPLLLTSTPVPQSPATDLWSLAITLLCAVAGEHPFVSFALNKFHQREVIKNGDPLNSLMCSDNALRNKARMSTLKRDSGVDVGKWFKAVLVKKAELRVSGNEWREMLVEQLETQ